MCIYDCRCKRVSWFLLYRVLIFLCYGLGEYCLWYDDIVEVFVKIGFYVFVYDYGDYIFFLLWIL